MTQPPGFACADNPTHICKLRKAIYGLKQAPRAWYNALKGHLAHMGFSKAESDNSLFIRNSNAGFMFILLPIKLSGSHNFATWKAQFSMLMHGHDLYGHLDGSTPTPIPSTTFGTNTTPNPAYTLWFHQDQLIQNALMASADPTIASAVADANTSKQAWDSLHTAYANKSQTRIFSFRDQLGRITKYTTPITEYLQCIRSLSDELATADAPVTNSELIVKILSGLGPEFRVISAAIRARDTIVTYEELYEKILDHELFLRHEEAKKTPGPITVAVATHNKSNNNTNNSQSWRQNARPNNTSQYHPPNNNTTIVIRCQLCNKFGHVASVCRSKSHNHFEAKANYITGFNTTANPWIVDSGTTYHITTEPHNLQPYHVNEDVSMSDARYRRVLGRLQYLSFTRPDISYAAGDLTDRSSTFGYILFLDSNPISWSSKKQKTVVRSSTEAEYRAVANALVELLWVRNLLLEMRLHVRDTPTIYCDNIGVTYLSENPGLHSRMKHIEVDFHFVRNNVEQKMVRVVHVHSADQLADMLTKALAKPAFEHNLFKLGLVTHSLT
uniref:Uncharacterized protein LOC104222599 n=1 Tax=Nicotiana sylvestris TaxID=4096 RepID=A0A1U7WD44_NICSY|nr:PREDICTED: uncharacterized protein LOC104222599 [Nicotiana sylvestris]